MEKYKILVVEDSHIERLLLKKFLSEDYELAEAENGTEALVKLQGGFKADLIISDLVMPQMNGKELLLELSEQGYLKDMPVLIATAAENIEDELECLKCGCSDFIRKPYNPELLKLRVENTLDRKAYYKLKEQMVVDTFEKHIDPSVVEFLLKKQSVNGGSAQQREMTILFADIRNFTSISEKLSPSEVFDLLTEVFTITNACIKKYQGVLDKYIGDSTMAFWGAPEDCSDGAFLASRAAMEMITNTRELFDRYSEKYGVRIALGIGINKGPAIAGNVGPKDRVDYTAIGDTVNTAARFQSAAPGGCIYIGQTVRDEIKDRIRISEIPEHLKLKGKEFATDVYMIEGVEQ